MIRLAGTSQEKKGQVLILSYVVLIFLTIIVAAFLVKAASENNLTQRQRLTQEAIYLAEGGIEDTLCKFSEAIANFDVQPDVAIWPPQPDPVPDPPLPHSTIYSSFHDAVVNSVVLRLEDEDRIVEIEGGAQALVRNYEITATVEHPLNNNIAVTLHQVAGRWIIPAFQHSVFYENDLELLPGPDMDFTGRIHSNQDIYLGANNTLTIDSLYLRSAANIYNRRKDNGAVPSGTVDIRITKQPQEPPEYAAMDGLDSDDPNWTTESQTRWGGTVKSSVHGVGKMAAPQVQSIQPGGFYANQSNVRIVNDVITQAGVELVEGVDIPAGTVASSTTFYNNREEKTVLMTEIDLKKLSGYAEGDPPGNPSFPNHLPVNGLLYATRDDAGEIYQPGIRLLNGEEIGRPGGLTAVTNDPLYILGDYNTINKRPSAVICDSINLLSSGWDDDSRSQQDLSQRNAADTTVNTAFIAGIDETMGGQYNGGLENYPRLHEKWSNINLNIRGAFLALWNSQIAGGAWKYGSPQYTAPRRNWDYEGDFNDVDKLPPFTPWAVEMHKVAWWKQ